MAPRAERVGEGATYGQRGWIRAGNDSRHLALKGGHGVSRVGGVFAHPAVRMHVGLFFKRACNRGDDNAAAAPAVLPRRRPTAYATRDSAHRCLACKCPSPSCRCHRVASRRPGSLLAACCSLDGRPSWRCTAALRLIGLAALLFGSTTGSAPRPLANAPHTAASITPSPAPPARQPAARAPAAAPAPPACGICLTASTPKPPSRPRQAGAEWDAWQRCSPPPAQGPGPAPAQRGRGGHFEGVMCTTRGQWQLRLRR